MSKYELKTKQTDADPKAFVLSVTHPVRKEDALLLLEMMREISGEEPRMWGDSIIGYGIRHYTYKSGQEGDWMRIGFSPRKTNLSLYVLDSYGEPEPLLQQLGKHKTGVGCLYVNKLADVNLDILQDIIRKAWNG